MTNISEILDIVNLNKMIEEGYISRRSDAEGTRFVFNYTAKAQWGYVWNHETLLCRGLVTDDLGNILARCVPKFFNYGQAKLPNFVHTKRPIVTEKMDGSAIYLHWHDGAWRATTRGSFNSPQADVANSILGDYIEIENPEAFPAGWTPFLEVICPESRVVVDYGDARYLVALSFIDIETGADIPHYEWEPYWTGLRAMEIRAETVQDAYLFATSEFDNSEGVVMTWPQHKAPSFRLKAKHPRYIQLHALITQTSPRKIWEILMAGEPIDTILDNVPDEFADWARKTAAQVLMDKNSYVLGANEEFDSLRELNLSRRKFAEKVVGSPFRPALFKMLDGKPIDELAWKYARPEAEIPFAHDEP